MAVGAYALTSLDEAKAYLGSDIRQNGIWLYCSQGDATAATATVSDTALTLVITGGAAAGTNTLTFADANKDTLGELVTAINALTGWKAGTIYTSDAASTDLVVTGALSCLGSANEITLKTEANWTIERLIDRATDLIERWCNRKLVSRVYTKEVYDGNGESRLILDQYPVTRVTRLAVGRANVFSVQNTNATTTAFIEVTDTQVRLTKDGTTTDLTISTYATINLLIAAIQAVSGWSATLLNSSYGSYQSSEILQRQGAMYCLSPSIAYVEMPDEYITEFYLETGTDEVRNPGILRYVGTFPRGDQNVFIWYVAGFTTIPAALELICLELVKYKYDKMKISSGLSSESLGDYSYSLRDISEGLPPELIEELAFYRRRLI